MTVKTDLESKVTPRASIGDGEIAPSTTSAEATVSPDYEEYLRLGEMFVGDRLRTLVRKIE